ncbi:GNAT family N-acetyltransferase [Conexibacter sp. SYSU D00693]|uniref:GNAT family N-acetyltransferase n=1 Tax=Conexibacter sp. SYSU D00693 TaxID=2812560 RepID=UPI00196B97C1|nr:GNAT family N-acetyltransferase [Conexibacter sp. SYSU D00693]
MPVLRTPRLDLRPFTPADVPAMAKVYGDPEVMRHVATGEPWSAARTHAILEAYARRHRRDGISVLAVVERATGDLLGDAGLEPSPATDGALEVGWTLRRDAWGRGVATEAGAACVRHALTVPGAQAVEALVVPTNTASVRVALKLGLRPAGHRHAHGREHRVLRLTRGQERPMDVVVAGAHGQIAKLLHPRLVARGDRVRGLIRNPDQAAALEALGVEPVVCDLEHADVDELRAAVRGADAFVFAAGAGPGSGAERKATMDRDGAVRTIRACEDEGVARYVIVSSIGADDPPQGDEVFAVYLRAKAEADEALKASKLDWTVVRPGPLTDDEPTGKVRAARHVGRESVPRADVADVLAAVLAEPETAGEVFELGSGDTPIDEAVATLARAGS